MWNALQKVHDHSNLSTQYLLHKLYKMKLDRQQDMCEHVNGMLEIVQQLHGFGKEMKNYQIGTLLLCSLPQFCNSLISALETRPEAYLILEYVMVKLTEVYNCR